MIKKNVMVTLTLSPEDLAREFADMDHREQAAFFNHLALIVDGWEAPVEVQVSAVVRSGILTESARDLIAVLGSYAYEGEEDE